MTLRSAIITGTANININGTVGATTPSTGAFTTVTDSGLTSGRVTYAGTAGLLQDSAALTYDGTAITINKNSSALPASPVAAGAMLLQIGNADAAQSAIVSDSFGSSTTVNFRRANGTNASKTAVTTGALAQIRAYGYGSTAYSGIRAQISFNAAETWTDAAQGSAVTIWTTPIGSATYAIVGTFTGTGLDITGTLTSTGTISPGQATTAAAPAYVKGAIYFDTTLNKLRVGGATAWETITSV